ncbi:MAG: LysM peptidoglycan-binding domain-containing protein, partial [Bacteroidales bacterium]|nr:LysM peptidoglycan-binding domain-containing protein [Bacteroidales bacterium]
MLRKVVFFVVLMTLSSGFVFSQVEEKTTKIVLNDSMLFYDHEVVKGQTLYGLSKIYQISIDDIAVYNPTVQQGLKVGEHIFIPLSKQKVEIHIVQKGETLYTIAKNRGVREKDLLDINPQLNENLSIGQEIIVPLTKIQIVDEDVTSTISGSSTGSSTRRQRKTPKDETEKEVPNKTVSNKASETNITSDSVFHIVEKGETLYGISKKYEVTIDAIKKANPHISETINVGERIYIPVEQDDALVDNGLEDENSNRNATSIVKNGVKKTEYTVYLLMPLYLSQVDSINPLKVKSLYDYAKIEPFSYIQFYEAMLLAVDDISTRYPSIKINLYVEEVETPSQMTALTLTGMLDDVDMIIGPFQAQEFSILSQYAKNKHILLVNLFSSTFESHGAMTYRATTSNAFVGESFANYILQKHPNANVLFVNYQSSQDSKQIANYRSAMQRVFSQAGKSINIQEINMKNSDISGIKSAVSNMNENFLFTFFEGELSVTNFTQSLYAAKIGNLTLIAPEKWLKYDNIETEYFMSLNTHYISQYFVDYNNPKVIRFIDAFRNAYETEPTIELHAFQGYDFTYYFLSKLCETGTSFQNFENNENLLSTKFQFVPSSVDKNVMENTFTHVFKIKNYRFIDAFSDNES